MIMHMSEIEDKLTTFKIENKVVSVRFVETQTVKEGVECDIYVLPDDNTRDLAVVRVQRGYKTPLQRILLGIRTIEGFIEGKGKLMIWAANGSLKTYEHSADAVSPMVNVAIGEMMQWHANGDTDLVFYEVCEPPYEDGRFENLPDDHAPSASPV